MSKLFAWLPLILFLLPLCIVFGQDRKVVVVIRHGTTPEGDIIRARADAALLLKQAELTGQKAYSQQLNNLMEECDVAYKRFSTRNKMCKEALENKYDRTFDIIRFNQQLGDIRVKLEEKGIAQRTRIGDPTDEMNSLLEKFARESITMAGVPVMKTELTSEQLDAIFLTDGVNTFSGKTGKTMLESFKWPFVLRQKEFQEEREAFDALCGKLVQEINAAASPSPETIKGLLEQTDAMDKTLDSLPLSASQSVRAVEIKWRKEAKRFLHELTQTLGNYSMLDSQKLSKYVFHGKTLGELIDHLDSNGLRFAHPGEQDSNLYASLFLIMRYAYQARKTSAVKTSEDVLNNDENVDRQANTRDANFPMQQRLNLAELAANVHVRDFDNVGLSPMTFSKDWIPVAFGEKGNLGPDDKSTAEIAVAARTFGRGRILVVSGGHFETPKDHPQFGYNVIRWLDACNTKTICLRRTQWSSEDENLLVDKCVQFNGYRKHVVVRGTPLTPADLVGCGVLLYPTQWDKTPVSEYDAIEKFVRRGGGLLMLGVGWSWCSYVDKNVDNFPMNQLGTRFAVHFDDGYAHSRGLRWTRYSSVDQNGDNFPMKQQGTHFDDGHAGNHALTQKVSLFSPYPQQYTPQRENHNILSVQYAVIALCDQAGLHYDWNASVANIGPSRTRRFIHPQLHNVPWEKAMDQILTPLGVTYELHGSNVILKSQ